MKKNDLLVLLVPSLLIILLWVIFNIYHSFVTSTIPSNLNVSIQFISPGFDNKAIDNIKQREIVEPSYDLTGAKVAQNDLETIISSSSANASQGAKLSQ